ncbi:zinc finger CCHC domain-containing protein 17-like isoform X2 [Frankliniella occidentalis]|uniref:Zinc finger CCHC domain-containing protein 17-like isoform X2 n=1 Tax=Frankliniella occidentalis TaxID=133901 RepID=A0A9C6XS42_FRAOC|nr:zinc finger CCHC domain-containing protein 17-like isoform X2 [Frankliniella occidentalis]
MLCLLVASVQTYGAFVKIPGGPHQGLVHRSQISKVHVPEVSDVLAKGDRVWCKIISTTDDGKIALSMKVVDQGSGKDLDPNGVQIKLDEQKRKEWAPGDKRKTISLDAVFNTTCSKCGTRGHLGKDCFQVKGGKTYDLIPEQDDLASTHRGKTESATQSVELDDKKERKKEKKLAKKEKKEAKKRKKAAKKLKKKLKKEAKKAKKLKSKKKKKHSSSDSSSDSSSSSSSSDDNSDSDKDSHSKEKSQKQSYSSHDSHTRRSRSRSPIRDVKRPRNDSHSSLEDRRRSRK